MVKVQPKSRRPGVQGTAPAADGPRLRIGVTEAAEGGRANQAVCALVARTLDRPRSAVSVVAGAASREKLLHVAGDPAALAERLDAL
ncbi:MAG: DUF167 domain-containing protein [Acetobacteraceae bacterium]